MVTRVPSDFTENPTIVIFGNPRGIEFEQYVSRAE